MKRIIGSVLTFLGAFLIVVALLAQFYAEPRLQKTPLDIDTETQLSGTIQLSDGDGGLEESAVKAFSLTRTDSEASDDEVAVWWSSQCLVKDEGDVEGCVSADDSLNRLVQATTDNFATDRVTALAVNDPKYLSPGAGEKEGLVNKWPFGAEKRDYEYWDSLANKPVTAAFDRVEELDGLETYVYRVEQTDTPIEVTAGVPGLLDEELEVFVEPVTGSMVDRVDHQERTDLDGNPMVILDLEFTDEQVAKGIAESKDNVSGLNLITKTVPLVGLVVGIPALLIGLALLLLSRREDKATA